MLNKTVSDVMNAAISHKCRSITFSDGVTSWKNYEKLIAKIHNFIIENDTCNRKFIMFHADDINSVKMYKRILRKVKWDSIDKLLCNTRTNFCASYLLRIQPNFWKFCKS